VFRIKVSKPGAIPLLRRSCRRIADCPRWQELGLVAKEVVVAAAPFRILHRSSSDPDLLEAAGVAASELQRIRRRLLAVVNDPSVRSIMIPVRDVAAVLRDTD